MSFDVTKTILPDHLRMAATGECSLDQIYEFIAEIKRAAGDADRHRVLIDIRGVAGIPSGADLFFAGERIAEVLGARLKAAVISPPERITKLGEMTAVNRGAKVLVSSDEAEAVEWLLAK
jgi:hypothetical protein